MLKQNIVPVLVVEHLDIFHPEASTMPVNLYHTHDYLVINAGLPRCLPDKVHVFVTPAKMLIQAEHHADEESSHEERTYILSELPEGDVGRVLDLPQGEWAYDSAEAHFANGLLTVTIPSQARAEYLRQMHTA